MTITDLRGFTIGLLGAVLVFSAACDGPAGPPGTANVYYSAWTPFDVANWSDAYSAFGQMRRDYPITESLVDSTFIAQGAAMVYVRIPGNTGETVYALPWIHHITKGKQQVLNFELEPGSIVINFYDLVDDTIDPGTFGEQVEHRYVLVPGGMAVDEVNLNLSDYDAVQEHFGIELEGTGWAPDGQ